MLSHSGPRQIVNSQDVQPKSRDASCPGVNYFSEVSRGSNLAPEPHDYQSFEQLERSSFRPALLLVCTLSLGFSDGNARCENRSSSFVNRILSLISRGSMYSANVDPKQNRTTSTAQNYPCLLLAGQPPIPTCWDNASHARDLRAVGGQSLPPHAHGYERLV